MQSGRAVRDLQNFRKEHPSAEEVQPLKELAIIKDQSYSFFTWQLDIVNPFPAPPATTGIVPIGTRSRIPVENFRPKIMPRGENTIYQIGVADSVIYVSPGTPSPVGYYPLPFLIRLLNFGDRVNWDFALFPGFNNTDRNIKTSMNFPNAFLDFEYGKNQGAIPDTVPAGNNQVFIQTETRTLDPLIDYNNNTNVYGRPPQYLVNARVRFYVKTTILI